MADGTLFGRIAGPIVVDLFAGGGGASLGIAQALGVSPVVAINHSPQAIAMHSVNHPETEHYTESVFDVAPLAASRGRRIDLLWASPTCTHFSRARGGVPVSEQLRVQGWIVVDWAREVRPRVIMCENVPEWADWGPLGADGKPDPARKGETFREFLAALRSHGYAVEYRLLVACDYGAPTIRKRLFLVARRDGQPIVWPAPTHGPGRAQPWPTAAECIDWSLPIPSIFERRKPLAAATQRRIAEGVRRYVLGTPDPFLLCLSHGGRLEPLSRPMGTITAKPKGGDRAVIAPVMVRTDMQSDNRLRGVAGAAEPLKTITTGGGLGVVAPVLVNTRNGERQGQRPRVRDIREPCPTVTAEGSQGGVVAAFLAKHYGGPGGHPTPGQDLRDPAGAVTSRGQLGPVTVRLDKAHGGHAASCAAFLMRYFGTGGQWADPRRPMPTITAREGLAVVTTTIAGEEYVLTDIGMRMLQPRELARAQGFPDSYVLTGNKGEQIERIGNSVSPPVARAIVEANLGELAAMAAK